MTDIGSGVAAVGGMLGILEKLREHLKGPKVEIENQEVIFHCPEDRGEYSVVLRVGDSPVKALSRTVDFPFPELDRLSVKTLPFCRAQKKAVQRMETGFRLHTNYLEGGDLFLLDFDFSLDSENSLDALVRRDCERDSPGTSDEESYWMNAQLRHLDVLDTEFGVIELQDYNFRVDVAVHQDIKNVVPKPFEKRVRIISEWINEKHRERKQKLTWEHLHEIGGGEAGIETDILASIQDLFIPSNFARFVEVTQPFKYHGAERGTDYYDDVPFPTFPKHMDVISRTDLSLSNPAANGELRYRRAEFRERLEELFPKTMKRLDR